MTSLITGLGGFTGFGADALERSDDGGSSVIDLTAIFGPQGLSFYGSRQTALVISTNGHVTFGIAASPFFSHEVMTLAGTPPTIAPYFADADTQGGSATASAGGTSTGSNQVWYHADASNGGSLVITWDDVGPFGGAAGQNAFQMVISGTGDGNFTLELRYENIEWTTWDLAGGVGFSAGDGRHYQLLPASGDAAALTALDSTVGNTGEIGVYRYQFIGGQPDAVTGAVTLNGTDGEDILAGTEQADRLDGGLGNDSLVGDRGDDTLVGGGGRDTLSGDLGDDTYRVDSLDDDVLEDIDEGIDTVEALGLSMTLGYQVENLRLLGDAALRLDGTGNALDNRLVGHAGDNLLDGGGGDDTMIGGAGNDTYRVDSSGDRIIENADEGVDTIETALSFTVAENVENLTLLGGADIDATGSAQANRLTGNAGNNRLDGAAGRDTLAGGAGNDTYLVDAGDVVIELAGEGTDQVQAALSWTLGDQIENLQLLGAAALSGTGNTLANILTGNSAANRLEGLAGDDTLDGGAGSDTLVGGAGNDTYLVDSAGDRTIERSASDGIDSVLSSV
ncbi:nidogen-like domain-containing protein, partial [Sphaerotilus uruguayifluvii]